MEIPSRIHVKLKQAIELRPKIIAGCVQQLSPPSAQQLEEIGSYVGSMTNSFRSALNYAIQGFCETNLKGTLPPNQYKRLKFDFPYSETRAGFDKIELVQLLASHFKAVYAFLEKEQPYHVENVWLLQLMKISNIDKHIVINEISVPTIKDVALAESRFRAEFFGDKVMASHEDGSVTVHATPCFIEPYQMFASKDGTWRLFLIHLKDQNLGLMKFIVTIEQKVPKLISDFFALF